MGGRSTIRNLLILVILCLFATFVNAATVYRYVNNGTSGVNPIVTVLAPTNITENAATINASTNVSAACTVHYGTACNNKNLSASDSSGTTHHINLSSLSPNLQYCYNVQCTVSGNTNPKNPSDQFFNTLASPQKLEVEWLVNNNGNDNSGNGITLTLAGGAQAPTYDSTTGESCRSQGLNFNQTNNTYATSTLANNNASWTYCWKMYLFDYGAASTGRVFSYETTQNADDLYVGVAGADQTLFVDVFDGSQRYETRTQTFSVPSIPSNVRLPICIQFAPVSQGGDSKVHVFIGGTSETGNYQSQPVMTGSYKTTSNTIMVGNRASQDRALGMVLDDFERWNYVITPTTMSTYMNNCTNNPSEDATIAGGAANVPLTPDTGAVKTVCPSGGGCTYTSISAAIAAMPNNPNPGWDIQVKNGTYHEMVTLPTNKSGTQAHPVTIRRFGTDNPIISGVSPNNAYGFFFTSSGATGQVHAWYIIDGFEITGQANTCINARQSNITIRNIKCHDVKGSGGVGGILIDGAGSTTVALPATNVLIDNNEVYNIGTGSGNCVVSGVSSPRHCHGIYLANHATVCGGVRYVTVRRNYVHDVPGSALQINGASCTTPNINNILIENNLFINVAEVFNWFNNMDTGTVRNNTGYIHSFPANDATVQYIEEIQGPWTNWLVENNIFWSDHTAIEGIWNPDTSTHTGSNQNYNLWSLVTPNWTWANVNRTDFYVNYQSVTQWDFNGKCCQVDPKFVSSTDWQLQSISPARNTGSNAYCAVLDYKKTVRPEEAVCEMGAYEYP